MLSLNKHRINERVRRSRDFKTISRSVSDVKESVSESGFERADALRVRVAQGSSAQSSGHAESRGLLSLFSNPCRKTQICPDQTWMLGLWWKPSWILDSPWRHVQQCHRKGKACCQDGADAPVELAFRLSRVSKKDRECGLLLFGRGALALGRAGVVVLLLGVGRAFAGLVIGLVRVRLVFGLVSRRSGSSGFAGEFSFSFPISGVDSLDEFSESNEGVRLFMVDHVVFDALGESIVSLTAECGIAPLNACG